MNGKAAMCSNVRAGARATCKCWATLAALLGVGKQCETGLACDAMQHLQTANARAAQAPRSHYENNSRPVNFVTLGPPVKKWGPGVPCLQFNAAKVIVRNSRFHGRHGRFAAIAPSHSFQKDFQRYVLPTCHIVTKSVTSGPKRSLLYMRTVVQSSKWT